MARPFRYCRDPLFLFACSAYGLNRLVLKPLLHSRFFTGHFNDLWLIPCALPPVLWLHHKLAIRPAHLFPTNSEILGHLVLWSIFCEWLGPKLIHASTADPLDVLAYTAGALLSLIWWRREKSPAFRSLE